MSQCQSCSAPTDIALCGRCATTLATILIALPGGIDTLNDVVLRQTRIGSGGKRAKGDEMPALYSPDTTTAKGETRSTKQAQASTLVDRIRNDVITLHRHICETRGVTWVACNFIGPLRPGQRREPGRPSIENAAMWLAENVSAIACDEAAGECLATFEGHARAVERIVDLPTQPKFLGPCPASVEHSDGRRERCNAMLTANPRAIEITCPNPKCRRVHNVERVGDQLVNEIDYYRFTRTDLAKVLSWLDETVPKQTLSDWITGGKAKNPPKLKPAGYQRPDGRFGINRHSPEDLPVYRLADVRKLRLATLERRKVGA